ncbi:MAG: T9SS type A sorting domain-containing protein [Flavobacterium sp.]|uniref:T9SS-dependent M36 family metallopeptidase n=1 Tax=Flavobacterium sp. TaxID=239 RepID=UPI0012117645|nr:T9SS-dependent M36 family metallopeptidase [Flavobacterium sp.]RZJ66577.1 MAG: T9SS type A sorting domain-containing protein [Flavobacterium sp.]
MKKITSALVFLLPLLGFSQEAEQKIQAYLEANRSKFGLTAQDVSDWTVESKTNSETTKIDNYFIKQRYNGTDIFRAVSNIWIKNGIVINGGENLVVNVSQKVNATAPSIPVLEALAAAETHLKLAAQPHMISETISPKNFVIVNGDLDPITAELVYQQMENNTLRLAWDFTIDVPGHSHLWSVRIDALDGKILEKNDLVISCDFTHKHDFASTEKYDASFTKNFFKPAKSVLEVQAGTYRVIPWNMESPSHGPRQLIVDPYNTTASPHGWHDINNVAGAEYQITRGNNVWAQEDVNANDGTGTSPSGGASLTFDFPYLGTYQQPIDYQPAAVTNLFYMNNMMHDIFYQYGFNEVNGNFQQNNYGNGGASTFNGDAVFADAQDGSGTENANFSTPVDGQRPRMQMYLWGVGPLNIQALTITSPAGIAGPRSVRDNSFSPGHVNLPVAPAQIESDLVLYNDGLGDTADACQAPINAAAISGHITVVRRGDCTFVEKVLFAQNAGATAVIVVNNEAGVIGMAGANAAVTIPAVSMTMEDGNALIAAMLAGTVHAVLSASEPPFVNSDGDFDNGIIAHEYGHGISTRLTGGPANSSCLQNPEQQGEGWSDFFAVMLQMKAGDVGTSSRGIATFVLNQAPTGTGLRQYPYNTNMGVNPFTFADTNEMTYIDEEGATRIDYHSVGSVWATMLWDLAWAYIEKYGFDPNVYGGTGGNNKVLRLVLDAMKLQPCGPTFVQARNAIIAAEQATTGGADNCMIWRVFARRGLGLNASSGTNTGIAGITDQVEDFTVPAGCELAAVEFNENMVRLYPNPSNGLVNVRIQNFSGKATFQVTDVNGRVVYNASNIDFNTEYSIDLSHLQTGMYMVRVSADNMSFTKKLILN